MFRQNRTAFQYNYTEPGYFAGKRGEKHDKQGWINIPAVEREEDWFDGRLVNLYSVNVRNLSDTPKFNSK